MTSPTIRTTQPDGPAAAVAWRRARQIPWIALPLAFIAIATGFRAAEATRWRADYWMLSTSLWAALAAGLAAAIVGRRFHLTPTEPDDDEHPIVVRWLGRPIVSGFCPAGQEVHVLGEDLRISDGEWIARDVVGMVLAAAVMWAVLGFAIALAVLFVAWALGFPRRRRKTLCIPWASVVGAQLEQNRDFRILRDGDQPEIVVEARFTQRDRLRAALAERLGEKFRGIGAPPLAAAPSDVEDDAGVGEVVLARIRHRRLLFAGVACLALSVVLLGVAYATGTPPLQFAAGGVAFIGCALCFVGAHKEGDRWRRLPQAPDDRSDPIAVQWTNRPGWWGPRGQQAHLLPASFRLVGHEWELWDILVIGALGSLVAKAGGLLGFAATMTALNALGLPRKRRIAADIPWDEIETVEIRGGDFEMRTALPEPCDVLRFSAKYNARVELTHELLGRLGDRASLVSLVAGGAKDPALRATSAEIAARTQRLRGLADGSRDG